MVATAPGAMRSSFTPVPPRTIRATVAVGAAFTGASCWAPVTWAWCGWMRARCCRLLQKLVHRGKCRRRGGASGEGGRRLNWLNWLDWLSWRRC